MKNLIKKVIDNQDFIVMTVMMIGILAALVLIISSGPITANSFLVP